MSHLVASSFQFHSSISARVATLEVFQTAVTWEVSHYHKKPMNIKTFRLYQQHCQSFPFITGIALQVNSEEEFDEYFDYFHNNSKYIKRLTLSLSSSNLPMNKKMCDFMLNMIHLKEFGFFLDIKNAELDFVFEPNNSRNLLRFFQAFHYLLEQHGRRNRRSKFLVALFESFFHVHKRLNRLFYDRGGPFLKRALSACIRYYKTLEVIQDKMTAFSSSPLVICHGFLIINFIFSLSKDRQQVFQTSAFKFSDFSTEFGKTTNETEFTAHFDFSVTRSGYTITEVVPSLQMMTDLAAFGQLFDTAGVGIELSMRVVHCVNLFLSTNYHDANHNVVMNFSFDDMCDCNLLATKVIKSCVSNLPHLSQNENTKHYVEVFVRNILSLLMTILISTRFKFVPRPTTAIEENVDFPYELLQEMLKILCELGEGRTVPLVSLCLKDCCLVVRHLVLDLIEEKKSTFLRLQHEQEQDQQLHHHHQQLVNEIINHPFFTNSLIPWCFKLVSTRTEDLLDASKNNNNSNNKFKNNFSIDDLLVMFESITTADELFNIDNGISSNVFSHFVKISFARIDGGGGGDDESSCRGMTSKLFEKMFSYFEKKQKEFEQILEHNSPKMIECHHEDDNSDRYYEWNKNLASLVYECDGLLEKARRSLSLIQIVFDDSEEQTILKQQQYEKLIEEMNNLKNEGKKVKENVASTLRRRQREEQRRLRQELVERDEQIIRQCYIESQEQEELQQLVEQEMQEKRQQEQSKFILDSCCIQ